MIADLDEIIRALLVAELPVRNGEIDISFDQPKREWSARLNRPAVNLFLYDVKENPTLRQAQWEQVYENGRRNGEAARLKRSPLRLDCFYLLTAWAADPEDEHRLLSRCLLALSRYPVLPAERLLGSPEGRPYEIPARLAQHDKLTNPAEMWSALDNELRPSISYILTLAFDPWMEISTPIVRSRTLRTGQTGDSAHSRKLQAGTLAEQVEIGGTVLEASGDGKPLAGIQVAVKGTGLFAASDTQGRFRLGSLPPGEYTLIAWPAKGRPKEKPVKLGSKGGDYDIEV
jgi:hypothetical protein